MKNELIYTTTFKHLYKKKFKAQKFIIDKFDSRIKELSETDRSDKVGIYKTENLKGIWVYELGNSNRLLYTIKYDLNEPKKIHCLRCVVIKILMEKDKF